HGLVLDSVHVPFAASSLALGDWNEDGHLDLAANGSCGMLVWLNAGDGSFGPPTSYTSSCQVGCTEWMAAGDINGDGHLDLVGTSQNPLSCGVVLLGRGDGTFQDVFGGAATSRWGPQGIRPPGRTSGRTQAAPTSWAPW